MDHNHWYKDIEDASWANWQRTTENYLNRIQAERLELEVKKLKRRVEELTLEDVNLRGNS